MEAKPLSAAKAVVTFVSLALLDLVLIFGTTLSGEFPAWLVAIAVTASVGLVSAWAPQRMRRGLRDGHVGEPKEAGLGWRVAAVSIPIGLLSSPLRGFALLFAIVALSMGSALMASYLYAIRASSID